MTITVSRTLMGLGPSHYDMPVDKAIHQFVGDLHDMGVMCAFNYFDDCPSYVLVPYDAVRDKRVADEVTWLIKFHGLITGRSRDGVLVLHKPSSLS